jgi:hypothetical protein
MKPLATRTILTVFLILAAQPQPALADPVYFDFSSQLSTVPNSVVQYNYGSLNFTPASPAGQGQAWLYSTHGTHVAGSSSIAIASLGWQVQPDPSSDFINGSPSTFNPQSFKLALTLTDDASHAQGTLYFQGTFGGRVPPDPSGTLSFTPSIQSIALGHNLYTVDLSHQTTWVDEPPDWMLEAAYGSGYDAQAQVTVKPLPMQPAPEPTSLTLAGLGLATILGCGLRWNGAQRKSICKCLKGFYPSTVGTLRDT